MFIIFTNFRLTIIVLILLAVQNNVAPNVCLYCNHVPIPQDCNRVLKCGDHEVRQTIV